MNAPVDVLAVMKQAADFCQPTDPTEAPTLANAMDEARAAVAELIECERVATAALDKLLSFAEACDAKLTEQGRGIATDCDMGDVLTFARAALARVQP